MKNKISTLLCLLAVFIVQSAYAGTSVCPTNQHEAITFLSSLTHTNANDWSAKVTGNNVSVDPLGGIYGGNKAIDNGNPYKYQCIRGKKVVAYTLKCIRALGPSDATIYQCTSYQGAS